MSHAGKFKKMKHQCGAILRKIGSDLYTIGQSEYWCPRCEEKVILPDEICEDCGFPKEFCICKDIEDK